MWGGVKVNVVGKDRDGVDMVVTEDGVVLNEREMWMTQKTYDKLKEST